MPFIATGFTVFFLLFDMAQCYRGLLKHIIVEGMHTCGVELVICKVKHVLTSKPQDRSTCK